jgi:hypothetical protein
MLLRLAAVVALARAPSTTAGSEQAESNLQEQVLTADVHRHEVQSAFQSSLALYVNFTAIFGLPLDDPIKHVTQTQAPPWVRKLQPGVVEWPVWNATMDRAIAEAIFPTAPPTSDHPGFAAWLKMVRVLRKWVRSKHSISPVYILESPSYFVEHLMPLFMAVPGWLVLIRGGLRSAANARIAHGEFGVPASVFLEVDPTTFNLFQQPSTRMGSVPATLLIACTDPWDAVKVGASDFVARWKQHPLAITLAHGVDEDPVYADGRTLDPDRPPEKWRDLRITHILQALLWRRQHPWCCRWESPEAPEANSHATKAANLKLRGPQKAGGQQATIGAPFKGSEGGTLGGDGSGSSSCHCGDGKNPTLFERMHLDPTKKTILYISTVGEAEFLDADGPSFLTATCDVPASFEQVWGLGQQVWQALHTLQRGLDYTPSDARAGYNVVVSLHPLLGGSRGVTVRLPSSVGNRTVLSAKETSDVDGDSDDDSSSGGGTDEPIEDCVGHVAGGWQGRAVGLVEALTKYGMLAEAVQPPGSSMLQLIDLADVVVAPVSSGTHVDGSDVTVSSLYFSSLSAFLFVIQDR